MEKIIPITLTHAAIDLPEMEQAYLSKMSEAYTLADCTSKDRFSLNSIANCLNNNERAFFTTVETGWYSCQKNESCRMIIDDLTCEIKTDKKFSRLYPVVDDWIDNENNYELIQSHILSREKFQYIYDIIGNTKIKARVTLFSNYNFLYSPRGYGYTYSYTDHFRDIVDVLHLNPAKLKALLIEKGFETKGRFPNKKYRQGHEAVSYEAFVEELLGQDQEALLVFAGMLPLRELYDNNFKPFKALKIPKGNKCGLFSAMWGTGSFFEMELQRDLVIPVNRKGKTVYDRIELEIDENGFGVGTDIGSHYGIDGYEFWKKEFQLIY